MLCALAALGLFREIGCVDEVSSLTYCQTVIINTWLHNLCTWNFSSLGAVLKYILKVMEKKVKYTGQS